MYTVLMLAASLALPQPDTNHAVGASKGAGQVYRLPFSHKGNSNRTGYYFIPKTRPVAGRPVVIIFHGLGDYGLNAINMWKSGAERHRVALVAPDSFEKAWQVPGAGGSTADVQHAVDSLYWIMRHAGVIDKAHIVAGGHSYGCRMAAFFGTNSTDITGVFLSHGRFIPASLGSHRVPAWFSGSPRDNGFNFHVMQDQWKLWPRGRTQLHSYDCSNCQHHPQAKEVDDVMSWAANL